MVRAWVSRVGASTCVAMNDAIRAVLSKLVRTDVDLDETHETDGSVGGFTLACFLVCYVSMYSSPRTVGGRAR